MVEKMIELLKGDCRNVLKKLLDNSVDSIVTDPPYELDFMGQAWDSTGVSYDIRTWSECLRVLKPGGHLLAFGGSRTYHRMACAVEDAGFLIRDQIMWIHGQGFPKSKNLGNGWGTNLKPAHEPIVVARKPLNGTTVQNMDTWGVGGLNIEECRVGSEAIPSNRLEKWSGFGELKRPAYEQVVNIGRWPANVIHDGSEEVIECFPEAPGQLAPIKYSDELKTNGIYGAMKRENEPSSNNRYTESGSTNFAMKPGSRRMDKGSAARFFYCAKANKKDRGEGNKHTTVKPTDLMQYLCRLVTPEGGTVLDPFMGSGTTGKAALLEGFNFIGVEKEDFSFAVERLSSLGEVQEVFA